MQVPFVSRKALEVSVPLLQCRQITPCFVRFFQARCNLFVVVCLQRFKWVLYIGIPVWFGYGLARDPENLEFIKEWVSRICKYDNRSHQEANSDCR